MRGSKRRCRLEGGRLADAGELSLIRTVRKKFLKKASGLILGIGDDAAVIRPRREKMLLTSDMMVEGVHFSLGWMTPFQLGHKLVSVNVSDVYAMGGRPEFLLVDFAGPGALPTALFESLFDGIASAAEGYGVSLVGGDMSAADRLVLSATLIGYASKVLTRSGARVGDRVYVSGNLGDAACGLRLLEKCGRTIAIEKGERIDHELGWKVLSPLLSRHLMPTAVSPGKFVRASSAMMDVSDGLLIDLSRLCNESGVGARIYEEKIPVSEALTAAGRYLRCNPLDLALGGGEDYELLFTAPEDRRVGAHCIGEITRSGLVMVGRDGKARRLAARGYSHFED